MSSKFIKFVIQLTDSLTNKETYLCQKQRKTLTTIQSLT